MVVNVTDLGQLQRGLGDAMRDLRSLDATIATLKFDPDDRSGVNSAIWEMERTIDATTGQHRGNRLVGIITSNLKEKYRQTIVERFMQARRLCERW